LVNFFAPGGLYAFMGLWAVPWMRDAHGLARQEASFYVSVMVVGFALGAIFWGWISDRLRNRKQVLIVAQALYGASWLGMILVSSWQGGTGLLLSLMMGFSGSGFILCMSNAKELSPPRFAGLAVATVNMGSFLGVAVIQPLVGKVLDFFWTGTMKGDLRVYEQQDYRVAFVMLLVFAVIALISAFFVKETHGRNTFVE
jgi:MFS family permease